ncbi:MAG: GNAT family N-acetyltransferase [Chloroflexota bacterium]
MTESIPNPTRESTVTLREITEDTLGSILNLKVTDAQTVFVDSNAESIAEAYFSEHAWFRAIYADETPVGFLMIHDEPDATDGAEYYLWRFMIDESYQRMGFGRQAMLLLIEHVKARPNATELILSYVPEEGSPKEFYEGLEFEHTGEEDDGELVMKLDL